MRREPVKIQGLDGLFCSSIRLSQRLKWGKASSLDEDMMIPELLAISVVKKDGQPAKTVDEWDEWGGEFNNDAHELFSQCLDMIGTQQAAKKK